MHVQIAAIVCSHVSAAALPKHYCANSLCTWVGVCALLSFEHEQRAATNLGVPHMAWCVRVQVRLVML